jgi:hypothetical protein
MGIATMSHVDFCQRPSSAPPDKHSNLRRMQSVSSPILAQSTTSWQMNLHTNSADATAGRKYRSKKQRPCDFCRSRKSQCRILNGSTGCELCKRLDRTCTFVLQPLRRERHQPGTSLDTSANETNLPDDSEDIQPVLMPAMSTNNDTSDSAWWPSPLTNGTLPYDLNSLSHIMPTDWSSMDFALGMSFVACIKHLRRKHAYHESDVDVDHDGVDGVSQRHSFENSAPHSSHSASVAVGALREESSTHSSPAGAIQSLTSSQQPSTQYQDWPMEFSLDSKEGHCNQLIGLSGESDPYVLRYYQYNTHEIHPMFRLTFRAMMGSNRAVAQPHNTSNEDANFTNSRLPVQFVLTDEELCGDDVAAVGEILSGGATDEEDARRLSELIPVELGTRLLELLGFPFFLFFLFIDTN